MINQQNAFRRVFPLFALLAWAGPTEVNAQRQSMVFVRVENVTQANGVTCDLKARTHALMTAALSRLPSVVTHLGDRELSEPELAAELKARGLKGYTIFVHITRCAHRLRPPPPGHVYRVLEAEVQLAIDAAELPARTMARAGKSAARVATEVRSIRASEATALRLEALEVAVDRLADDLGESLRKKRKRRWTRKRGRFHF